MAKAKPVTGIDCDAPVHAGMKRVLTTRFEEMCAFRNAVLDWSNPTGVHDMRVASRRLRGALEDFAPCLEKRRFASAIKQIKHIARSLGQVRDHDVAIMTLEETAATAPADVARGIHLMVGLRNSTREEERVKTLPVLDTELLEQLRTEFMQALAQANPRKLIRHMGATANRITYREVARTIILGRLEELEEMSDSLYRPLKKKPLHEMRIAAKHLRYAIELFSQCWDPSVLSLAKKVSALQTSLGKLHDCDVWIEDLGDAATEDQTSKDFDKTTTVWLLTYFVKTRTKHLSEAMTQWHEWETSDLSAQLRQALI
jgi:CHAD domain-containing protein